MYAPIHNPQTLDELSRRGVNTLFKQVISYHQSLITAFTGKVSGKVHFTGYESFSFNWTLKFT